MKNIIGNTILILLVVLPSHVFIKTAVQISRYAGTAQATILSAEIKESRSGSTGDRKRTRIMYEPLITYSYQVEYTYDRVKNDYLRMQAGEVQTDKINEQELRAKNVIVQYIQTRLIDASRLGMDTVGNGEAVIFMDGDVIEGTWKKTARDERTRFYNANGEEVKFNRGQTWVEVLPTDRSIEY